MADKTSADWKLELELSDKQFKKWNERGKKIVRRYRDDRDALVEKSRRYNVLWSNVRTLKAAIYARVPKPDVSRRYDDQDPIGRTASLILERCLTYEVEQYNDFDSALRNALDDRLLCGRGIAWVRYEPITQPIESEGPGEEIAEGEYQVTEDQMEEIAHEQSPVDYVYWEDFRHDPARTWEEVRWVARRVYMSQEEGIERFGDEFKKIPLTNAPTNITEEQLKGSSGNKIKKAEIWEIWCKEEEKVYWICPGYMGMLDQKDDPLQLDGFFPCPKPLFSTLTTDSLVPVPDYAQYQDQAEEIDELTERINLLVKAIKVVGVYDASQTGVQRMLIEGTDNVLIPVDKWAAFAEKGGIKGTVDFLPLDNIAMTLSQLYNARDHAKQVMYEITGMSDIIRGASLASETATAQQIKSQYANLRLKEATQDLARFATDLIRIKAQIICNQYQDQTIISMSGIANTRDGQMAQQAIQMLRDKVTRNFRIDIETDSMVITDEMQEKQDRVEFLTAAGGFLDKAVQAGMSVPEIAPLLAEMLMFGVRGFRAGKTLESAFEQAMGALAQKGQQPQQDPAAAQAQMLAQQKQQEAQMKAQTAQMEAQYRAQADAQVAQIKANAEQMLEAQRQQFERWKTQLQEETKVIVASIGKSNAVIPAQTQAANQFPGDIS